MQLFDLSSPDQTPMRLAETPDPKTICRRNDPASSKESAAAVAHKVPAFRAFTARCVNANPGLTQAELEAIHCPTEPRKVGRWLKDCEKHGLIRRQEKDRVNPFSGRMCDSWWPVELDPERKAFIEAFEN